MFKITAATWIEHTFADFPETEQNNRQVQRWHQFQRFFADHHRAACPVRRSSIVDFFHKFTYTANFPVFWTETNRVVPCPSFWHINLIKNVIFVNKH